MYFLDSLMETELIFGITRVRKPTPEAPVHDLETLMREGTELKTKLHATCAEIKVGFV